MKRAFIAMFICILVGIGSGDKEVENSNYVEPLKPQIKVNLEFDNSTYKYYPSFAVWLEDVEDGKTETIYATKKVATNKWMGSSERPSALPIWYGELDKEFESKKSNRLITLDAISSATISQNATQLILQIPEKFVNRKINIYLEVNVSFDYNDYFKEDLKEGEEGFSGVNGQPSLLWKAYIDTSKTVEGKIVPEIIGNGEVLGEDHIIHNDISNITTAKQILSKIEFEFVNID